MIDLKWNPAELGINWNPPQAGEPVTDPNAWEPELVEGGDALIQSFFIALRSNPLTRALYQSEPDEADLIAAKLKESLEDNNPEVVKGSLNYALQGGKLNLQVSLLSDGLKTLDAYFKDVFHAG